MKLGFKKDGIFTWLLSLIVGLGLFFLIFFFIEWDKLFSILSKGKILPIIWAIILNIFVMVIKGIRWKQTMGKGIKVSTFDVIELTILGFFFNTILPARAGDLGKAFILAKNGEISKIHSIGTVTLDKAMDLFSILLLMLPLLFFMDLPLVLKEGIFFTTIVGIVVFITVMFIAKRFSTLEITEKTSKLKEIFIKLGYGFSSLNDSLTIVYLFLLSILSWILQIFILYLTGLSLNISINLANSLLILIAINLAIALPGTPGNIGTMHASIFLVMQFLGYKKEEAMGIAILFHAVQILPLFILGPIIAHKLGLKLFTRSEYHGTSGRA